MIGGPSDRGPLGNVLGFPGGVELALERDLLPAQQRANDLQRLLEAADAPVPWIAERHMLGLEVSGAEPQDEAPSAQLVDGVGHPREQGRITVSRVYHQGSDLHPARLPRQRAGGDHALPGSVGEADQLRRRARPERFQLPCGGVAEVVDQPHRVEPDLLGPAGESHDVRSGRSVATHRIGLVRQTESDLHLVELLRGFRALVERGAPGRSVESPRIALGTARVALSTRRDPSATGRSSASQSTRT